LPWRWPIDPAELGHTSFRDHKPGEKVALTVVRDGDREQLEVTLGEAGAS
jgi:S1-C subfamily serine protease